MVEGWYDGDGGLRGSYNGKSGSRGFVFVDFLGEKRAASDLTDILFGDPDTCSRGRVGPASLRRSTMAASAACCSPFAGAWPSTPNVAVVLAERRDVFSERGFLLYGNDSVNGCLLTI